MSYAKLLYRLSAERLREIVNRRAATLRGIPRIADRRALAEFLSEALCHPESILETLPDTNLLQLQLLIYVIVQGGAVAFETVLNEAGGEAAREPLEEAIDGLESLGLMLWD